MYLGLASMLVGIRPVDSPPSGVSSTSVYRLSTSSVGVRDRETSRLWGRLGNALSTPALWAATTSFGWVGLATLHPGEGLLAAGDGGDDAPVDGPEAEDSQCRTEQGRDRRASDGPLRGEIPEESEADAGNTTTESATRLADPRPLRCRTPAWSAVSTLTYDFYIEELPIHARKYSYDGRKPYFVRHLGSIGSGSRVYIKSARFIVSYPTPGGMETRKVQVTGGSTYTVSLPKEWATDNDVSAGSVVEFYSEEDILLLSPQQENDRERGTLSIDGLDDDQLTRAVMTMYVSGFDVITFEAARVTASQRRTMREATQGLVGLEVIEETGDRVVLQDLLDSSELSVHNAITRMRLVAMTMLSDAVTALVEDDDELAHDVMERDDDVDRLWYMVSRVFRTVLRNPSAATDIGLPRETVFDYQSSARQLERIADHATKIAGTALEVGEVDEEVVAGLQDLQAAAENVPETAMDALLTDDPDEAVDLATDARAELPAIDARAREVGDVIRDLEDLQLAQSLALVVDSLSRTADYGGNIAESALQKAAPSP